MSDGMEIYRAYLAARALAEALHAAHHAPKDQRQHYLISANEEMRAAQDRIDTAVLHHIKPARANAPAA